MILQLTPGALVAGRFRLDCVAGTGGMGTVWKAHDQETDRAVALKIIAWDLSDADAARFDREVELLSEFQHPGIVSYVSHGKAPDGNAFLAMEWLDGEDLAERLVRGPIDHVQALTLVRSVANALAEAHRRGVIHRDLKPSNLFLCAGEPTRIVLLDFGIARRMGHSVTAVTRTGMLIGTPAYMAPEQARSEMNVGPPADVFALGGILFECIAGVRAFAGEHIHALLAKILFEEARRLRALRSDVPPSVDALVARMLDKDPAKRPQDAAALAEEIEKALATAHVRIEPRVDVIEKRPSLRPHDVQLFSTIIAITPDAPLTSDACSPEEMAAVETHQTLLRNALSALGTDVAFLPDGSLVATISPLGSATDQAAHAARCALVVRERLPGARIALATGRGVRDERKPVGEAIDRAARLAARPLTPTDKRPKSDVVLLDELTAGLLDGRFVVVNDGAGPILQGERIYADESRLLLGKPTPCVGREQETGALEMVLDSCMEGEARVALVVGTPGMGKSRLKHEFLRRLAARERDLLVLVGRGDLMAAGSPYRIMGDLFRQLSGIEPGDSLDVQRRKLALRIGKHIPETDRLRICDFIGELCGGLFFSAENVRLAAARADPKIMSDQVSQAFVDWLRAECLEKPVLIVLEDMQWGDGPTVRLLDVALCELESCPLMVLALARPEIQDIFPSLWSERRRQEIRLGKLSKRASEQFVREILERALSQRIGTATLTRIVEQAAGNPLFLEELVRACAEGKGEAMPETVLVMLQSRLLRLPPEMRGVLRAASIFGPVFPRAGVVSILGDGAAGIDVDRCFEVLRDAEFIELRRGKGVGLDGELTFRHALVRDAAYGLLTDEDRATGHNLAAAWYSLSADSDPAVVADHYQQGGSVELAIPFHVRAAHDAFTRTDSDGAFARANRGIECGASGEALGHLLALQCCVLFWRGEWQRGFTLGDRALSLLPSGGSWSCRVLGCMLTMASASVNQSAFPALVGRISTLEPDPDARTAYIDALSQLLTMFSYLGDRKAARAFVDRMAQIDSSSSSARPDFAALGGANMGLMFYTRNMGADPWQNLIVAKRYDDHSVQIGSQRGVVMARIFVGNALMELGEMADSEATLRESLVLARRLGEPLNISIAQINLARHLAAGGDLEKVAEVIKLVEEGVEPARANALVVGQAYHVLCLAALSHGKVDEAEAYLNDARAKTQISPVEWFRTQATWVDLLLLRGRVQAAREAAEEGNRRLEELGTGGFVEIAMRLAVAKARHADGELEQAREAIRQATEELERRAACIPDPAVRAKYLEFVPENARVAELARAWALC